MFREICEAYHCTPAALDDLTYDQLYIMHARKTDLRLGGPVQRMDIFAARAAGAVPKADLGQPQSLVQRIRARNKAEKEAAKKQTKRQKRREWEQNLKAARARGEKV